MVIVMMNLSFGPDIKSGPLSIQLHLTNFIMDGETEGAVIVIGWEDISAIKSLTVGIQGSRMGSRRPIEAMDA